jgi:DNA (cytosine-5)-methyltransferase 1
MSWLYSRVLVEEFLGDIYSDGEQSVQSSGNNTPQAYCAPDKMMGFSRLSRFGMTFKPLEESRGEELLTLCLEAFRAPTLVPQEKGQELTDKPRECGEKWRGSFTKYDHDTSLWRTHQCSLLGDLDEFSETWPQWGLMRDGECWEQLTLERHIRGIGFGLSPNGMDTFHTPNTTGLDGGSNSRRALKKRQEQWPTPCLPGNGGTNGKAKMKTMLKEKWPTPVCQDSRHAISRHLDPNNTYWKSNLGEVVMSLEPTQNGRLNPTWVEWLMGWPQEWTDLKPLEMDKYQEWLQQHGES